MEVIGSLYVGVSDDFQRGVFPIARCVKAQNHDLGVVLMEAKRLGNLYGDDRGTGFAGNVWDKNYIAPSLTTMQGGMREPMITDSQIVAMRGRNPDNPSDRTTGCTIEQRLEMNAQGTSNCLTSVQKDNLVIEPQYRIRKLTPRECGRLMGVADSDIDKMAAINSNSQLYKQFGNSIVVDVMAAMFKNLNLSGDAVRK